METMFLDALREFGPWAIVVFFLIDKYGDRVLIFLRGQQKELERERERLQKENQDRHDRLTKATERLADKMETFAGLIGAISAQQQNIERLLTAVLTSQSAILERLGGGQRLYQEREVVNAESHRGPRSSGDAPG